MRHRTPRLVAHCAILFTYAVASAQGYIAPTAVNDLQGVHVQYMAPCGTGNSRVCYNTAEQVNGASVYELRSSTGAIGNSAVHVSINNDQPFIESSVLDKVFYRLGNSWLGNNHSYHVADLNVTVAPAAPAQVVVPFNVPCGVLIPQVLGNNLICSTRFSAAVGEELVKVSANTGATTLLKDIDQGTGHGIPACGASHSTAMLNGRMYFVGHTSAEGNELWSTDGTTAGTQLVNAYVPGPASAGHGLLFSGIGKLFLTSTNPNGNPEPYCYDPATNTLVLLKEIMPGSSVGSAPWDFIVFGDRVLFTAENSSGRELWVTDGTPQGTTLFADLHPYGSGNPRYLTKVGSNIFFFANDDTRGIKLKKLAQNGTITNVLTIPVGSSPMYAAAVGNGLVYTLRDANYAYTLHHSNGTAAGTRIIKLAANSVLESEMYPHLCAVTANGFYFIAEYSTSSKKLWKIPLNP